MDEVITIHAEPGIRSAAWLFDLWTQLVTTCRTAGGRAGLLPANETSVSRNTGGRC